MPHWGWYETCWTPWPWPANFAHCPMPPPATFVTMHPIASPPMPPIRTLQPGTTFERPGVAPAPTFPGPNGAPEEIQLPPPTRRVEPFRQ